MDMHFLSDGLEVREHPVLGHGVYALRPFATGELLAVWGGSIITTDELERLTPRQRAFAVQVEEGLHLLTPRRKVGGADYINHCCEPNAGLDGAIALVALRPIGAGEEISYDYAMSDSTPDLAFDCRCGSPLCRGHVSGQDWRDPVLQQRYEGRFSPYLMRRIAAERDRAARAAIREAVLPSLAHLGGDGVEIAAASA